MQNTTEDLRAKEAMEKLNKAVYKETTEKFDAPEVKGYDFNKGRDYAAMFDTYINTGF